MDDKKKKEELEQAIELEERLREAMRLQTGVKAGAAVDDGDYASPWQTGIQ